jgi:dolichol-phosphate mannosyltransferase
MTGPDMRGAKADRKGSVGYPPGGRDLAVTRHPGEYDLAVVIPAWNERENLELLLPALRETLDGLSLRWEIIVVDGGSNDGTAEAAACRGARVIQQRERGYGAALTEGIQTTRAAYVVTMDADLSHRPIFIEDLWKSREQAEVLVASRYVPGGESRTHWFRRLCSRILNVVYTRLLSLPLHDISSGFRLYHREILDGLGLRARDFDILEEILIKIYSQGFLVRELPFRYLSRGTGRTHVRFFKFGWAYLKTLVRMWQLRNSVASADYDHRAFDSIIPLQRYWQRARHRIVLTFLAASARRTTTLDIGCGSSRIIQDLPELIGMDILLPKLRFLRDRHSRLVQGDIFALPFPDAAFDAVICSEVIEHIPDRPSLFTELTRILRPGGTLILGTPDYGRWLWWVLEYCYGKILPGAYAHEHIQHYTRATLTERLRAHGFAIQEVRYVGFCEMIFRATKPVTRGDDPHPCLGAARSQGGDRRS